MGTSRRPGVDPTGEVATWQFRVRARLDDVRDLPPGSDDFAAAAAALIQAAEQLIDVERRLPVLLDEEPARFSLRAVRAAGAVAAAAVGVLVLTVLGRALAPWWLALAAVCLAGAVTLLRVRVPRAGGPHADLRPGAAAVAGGSLLLLAGAFLSVPVALAGALLVGGAMWQLHPRRVPDRSR